MCCWCPSITHICYTELGELKNSTLFYRCSKINVWKLMSLIAVFHTRCYCCMRDRSLRPTSLLPYSLHCCSIHASVVLPSYVILLSPWVLGAVVVCVMCSLQYLPLLCGQLQSPTAACYWFECPCRIRDTASKDYFIFFVKRKNVHHGDIILTPKHVPLHLLTHC